MKVNKSYSPKKAPSHHPNPDTKPKNQPTLARPMATTRTTHAFQSNNISYFKTTMEPKISKQNQSYTLYSLIAISPADASRPKDPAPRPKAPTKSTPKLPPRQPHQANRKPCGTYFIFSLVLEEGT